MRTLAQYTSPELVVSLGPNLTATDAITALVDSLDRAGRLLDRGEFLKAVLTREQLSPTSCSCGLAMPHARLAELPQLSFALGRSEQPILWSRGGSPTGVVLLFAVPEGETRAYLNLIASVARFSQDAAAWSRLLQAPDPRSVYSVLEQVAVRESGPLTRKTASV